jgi:hypothetical protein
MVGSTRGFSRKQNVFRIMKYDNVAVRQIFSDGAYLYSLCEKRLQVVDFIDYKDMSYIRHKSWKRRDSPLSLRLLIA